MAAGSGDTFGREGSGGNGRAREACGPPTHPPERVGRASPLRPRSLLLWAAVVLLGPGSSCADPSSAPATAPAPAAALRVENGRLRFADGRDAAIGLNYFDGFSRLLAGGGAGDGRLDSGAAFAVFARHEIPFVRFAACGFYPDDLEMHRDRPKEYFALLDGFVREAENRRVGLVPSLFWAFFAVPDLVQEPIQAWGDPQSATRAYMRRYTTELVTRYRSSPAIWAWEFGNEFNLEADVPHLDVADRWVLPSRGTPPRRGDADRLRAADYRSACAEFASLVRALDPVRPISTGHAAPRVSSWHLGRGLGWRPDSLDQSTEVMREDHAGDLDLVSVHLYWGNDRAGHHFPADLPVPEKLAVLSRVSTGLGKPLWLGEFGADPGASPEERRRQTEEFVACIETLRVPLSALWVFDTLNRESSAWNVRADNENAWALELLRDANRRLRDAAAAGAGR